MTNMMTSARKFGLLLAAATFAIAAPAFAQAPSQAQRDAIKSQCRSDYIARCSSVPPGGEAALQCLQKNMSSLSSGCQGAVRAVEAAAAKPAETAKPADTAKPAEAAPQKSAAPAAATAAPSKSGEPKAAAAAPAAGQPTSAQISAIRSACRSDYPKVCAGVPTGGAPALQCLEKNKGKLSAGCEKAVAAASGGGAAAAAAPAAGAVPAAAGTAATAAPTAAPTVIVLRPMRPREELFVLRSACGADVRTICGGVPAGGGRIVLCLATNAAQLSPACKDVLSQFAAR
ncbi:cysteine rich repeat-containing protein [Bradyrhizobium sp. RDI18]|uniref:cysteine rich repeat-containing protein n=1 Tax=Bradyrhizobium sp. RDI18 TaxID=3367400 RepID=UPI00371AE6DA